MALDQFQKTLSDVVHSDKLSGSRVEKVRTEAAREFHHGEALAGIILKVHRSAPDKTKLSSLYLFDAVSRFAQDVVRRRASGFEYKESRPPKGSKASAGTKEAMIDAANAFLMACADIVEDIVLSTAQAVRPDQREKVAKVVDIWLKANTFDGGRLDRIRAKALSGESSSQGSGHRSTNDKETENGPTSMGSPYGMAMHDDDGGAAKRATSPQAPTAAPNVPSNLLALLGGGSTVPKTSSDGPGNGLAQAPPPPPSLDPNQIAMLKRVAAQQQRQPQAPQNLSTPAATAAPPPQTTNWQQNESQYGASRGARDTNSYQSTSFASIPPAHDDSATTASTAVPVAGSTTGQPHFQPNARAGDLTQFDLTAFDPTSVEAWVRFAQQWHNTYQYVPTNQELIFALMQAMQSQFFMQAQMMQAAGGGLPGMDDGQMSNISGDPFNGNGGNGPRMWS